MEQSVQQLEPPIQKFLPDKYEEVTPVKGGQNATVFCATNKFLRKRLFLKVYPFIGGKESLLLQEPQVLAGLSSRYVASITDAEVLANNQLLLAMEVLDGGSFQDQIDECNKEQKWGGLHQILDAIRDVAFGLNDLHEEGFVHRDIKPANLMFRNESAGQIGVVTDLGLIGKIKEAGRAERSTHARAYRPPEAFSPGSYSRSSDIYQLGLVLYQMLGGVFKYPLGSFSEDDLQEFILAQQMLDYDSLSPVINSNLRAFLKACICPESNRFQSIPEFLLELNNLRETIDDWSWSYSKDRCIYARQRQTEYMRFFVDLSPIPTLSIFRLVPGSDKQIGKSITLRKKNWQTQREFTQKLNLDYSLKQNRKI